MIPEHVAWIDPGGMTGIAVYSRPNVPDMQFWCDEFPFHQACERVERMCDMYGAVLAVGWERYTITGQSHKKTPQGQETALKVIGWCEHMAWKRKCQVLPPAQQASPSAAERAALQRLGWWVPGKDDAQSAAAHMLRWMLASRNAPPHVMAAMREQGEEAG